MRSATSAQSELHLVLKALGYFKTHWWLFLIEVIALYGYNILKFSRTPPVYESHGSLLIDNSRSKVYRSTMLGSDSARKRNMVYLLASQEVFNRFTAGLTDYYNTEGRPKHLRPYFPNQVLPTSYFQSAISLNWDRSSDIYSINCNGPNPEAAHALCLIYMNIVQEYYPEIGRREVMMKREFLSRQIATMTREVTERETALVDFQGRNTEFFDFLAEGGKDRVPRELRNQIRILKNEIEENRALKELFLNIPAAKRGEHSSLRGSILSLTKNLEELSAQLQLTEQSVDPGKQEKLDRLNSEISRISSQLAALNEKELMLYLKNPINVDEARGQLSKLEFEYRMKLRSLRRAEHELALASEKARRFQTLFLENERVSAELNHRKALLDNLYKQEQRTEIELSAGQAEIYRLQEPSANYARIAPQLRSHLYRALSLSVFAIALTCVLLIALVPRLDSENEVHRLNLPVIGKIPSMRQHGRSLEDLPSYGLEHLKIMHYRMLRETKDIKCPIVIVSSPNAREGKSTVAHSLALTSQSQSRRTLLVDGDMLTFRPYKFLGIQEDQTPGLKAILVEGTPPPVDQLIVPTVLEGVSFMPRGERLDPTQLNVGLKAMEGILKNLRTQYDLIIIDTPPLFASNLAHQWCGYADLIVLVARMYSTRPKDILDAIQTCKVFSKAPLGLALNCVPLTAAHRRASNYYFSRNKAKSRLAA